MRRILCWILLALTALFLSACGGGSGTAENGNNNSVSIYGIAQLGYLSGADVEIYRIENNGTMTLQWREKSSSGTTLDEIGRFDLHIDQLDPNGYYVYNIIGGEDWDADDDGIKDQSATINNGVIRAVVKGSDIIEIGSEFRVTLASEMLYEFVAKTLKYEFNVNTFQDTLKEMAAKIVTDIDGNGDVDIKDIVLFNPVEHKNRLKNLFKAKWEEWIQIVHDGRIPAFHYSQILGSTDTPGSANGVAISSDGTKAYVADNYSGLQIIDISDPANPTILGGVDTPGYASGVAISSDGTKACVADDYSGLQIVDISDPANPTILGGVDTPGYASGV
ncbi:hypothetical protein, partial [Hydrogenimonas sp.]